MRSSIILVLTFLATSAHAGARVSVLRFEQEAQHVFEHCNGWVFSGQTQLRTVLEGELSKRGLQVLERKDLRQLYGDEFELENLNRKTVPKRKKFLSANFTIAAAVTELGICEDSSDSGFQLGGLIDLVGGTSGVDLGVEKRKSTSRVKVAAQIISTETGEVVKTLSAEAQSEDSGSSFEAGYAGIGTRQRSRTIAPIERVTNKAIVDLAEQIVKSLAQSRTKPTRSI